ncbi:hypothetical protein ACIBL6_43970 [Streptomyces sp. NPDC050400]|uniref:hypothetical protein n=1 Tax=Streptomyces sp. NPDC050400 TaxID=3365610 RepID=UPI00378AF620
MAEDRRWRQVPERGTCPVHERDRVWIERRAAWCAEQFGPPPKTPALPGFAPRDAAGPAQERAEDLVRRVAAVMGADVSALRVRLVDPTPAAPPRTWHQVGEYRAEPEGPVIDLDRTVAARPDTFAALIAHELAHARLSGEGRLDGLDLSGAEEERLTDLVAVHLGLGVLTANAADNYTRTAGYSVTPLGGLTDWMLTGRRDEPPRRLGYLTPAEHGYALTCWTLLRSEPHPPWAHHLVPSVRAALTQGLAYRAARGN